MAQTITTISRHEGFESLSKTRAVLALWVACALVYWPASAALFGAWVEPSDRTYRHGFLVLAACLWLVQAAAEDFAAAVARPSRIALVLLAGASFAWVLFWRAAIQDLFLLLTPVILWLAIAASSGWSAARVMAFPVGFIYFAEPAWGSLASPLQHLTAIAVTGILQFSGMPVSRQDVLISVPSGGFHVDLGCSGVHYVIVGLALAALIGSLERATMRRRFVLLGIMLILAIGANWVRVATIVVAGHLTNMQHWLVTRDHYWFGWGLFVLVVAGFMWWARRTEEIPAAPSRLQESAPVRAILPSVIAALACIPALGYAGAFLDSGSSTALTSAAPGSQWSGPYALTSGTWQPHFAGADEVRMQTWVDHSGRTVESLLVGYRKQSQGSELVHYANSLTGERLSVSEEKIIEADGEPFIETLVVDDGGRRSVIWWRYEIGGQRFVTALYSQLWYGFRALAGSPPSSIAAFRSMCVPDCEAARGTLTQFMAHPSARAAK